ncbi:MAG: ComEA family DNA-binding protein [Rubricoccaceae bacterium]
MRFLYRLQTRAGLTAPEGTAVLVLGLALAAGLAVQQLQGRQAPLAADFYAASDAAFAAALLAAREAPGSAPAGGPAELAVTGQGADAAPAPGDAARASDTLGSPDDTPVAALAIPASVSARRSGARKPPPVRTNVNTADAAQLQRLPRIGPAMAERIIAYRQQHGRFARVEDLLNVKGIGPKTLEQMAPYVTL